MRNLPAAALIAVLAAVFAVAVILLPDGSSSDATGDIRIVSRLDEFTKNVGPAVANSIPGFLGQPGLVGVVPAEPPAAPDAPPRATRTLTTSDVTAIDEVEVQKGICAPTLPRLVRAQYPGSYDGMSDAQLEKQVLAKRPEYRDRLCVFPVWISAGPHEIVKYEVEAARTLGVSSSRLLRGGIIAVVFGAAGVLILKLRSKN
jgi:hypothetical protein